MSIPTEGEFQRALEIALNAPGRDTVVWRQQAGKVKLAARRDRAAGFGMARDEPKPDRWMQLAPKGASDLTGIVEPDGWRLEVECKGLRTRITPEQTRWAELIRRMGGIAVTVHVLQGKTLNESVAYAVRIIDGVISARRGY